MLPLSDLKWHEWLFEKFTLIVTYCVEKEVVNWLESLSNGTYGTVHMTHSAVTPMGWKSMTLLAEAGADVNVRSGGKTLLMWTVESGYTKCVETLMKAGANVNMVVEPWSTALHVASGRHNNCFEMLLKTGADVNIKGQSGQTVLMSCMTPWQTDVQKK